MRLFRAAFNVNANTEYTKSDFLSAVSVLKKVELLIEIPNADGENAIYCIYI